METKKSPERMGGSENIIAYVYRSAADKASSGILCPSQDKQKIILVLVSGILSRLDLSTARYVFIKEKALEEQRPDSVSGKPQVLYSDLMSVKCGQKDACPTETGISKIDESYLMSVFRIRPARALWRLRRQKGRKGPFPGN